MPSIRPPSKVVLRHHEVGGVRQQSVRVPADHVGGVDPLAAVLGGAGDQLPYRAQADAGADRTKAQSELHCVMVYCGVHALTRHRHDLRATRPVETPSGADTLAAAA